jgi:lysozyme
MDLLTQLKRDEGMRASAYQDSLGYWTIGIGVCVDARKGCGLTSEEMEYLATNRIDRARAALLSQFPWLGSLDEIRMNAVLNMAYQMGAEGVGGFRSMLIALQAQDFEGASVAALDSIWAKTQSPTRARRVAQQLKTGVCV